MVGFLGVDPAGGGSLATQPMKRIGDQRLAQAGSLTPNRHGQSLKVAVLLGMAGDCVAIERVTTNHPQPRPWGGANRFGHAVVIELPEPLERFGIKFDDGAAVITVGSPELTSPAQAFRKGIGQVSAKQVKGFVQGKAGDAELVPLGRTYRTGDHLLKALLMEVGERFIQSRGGQ